MNIPNRLYPVVIIIFLGFAMTAGGQTPAGGTQTPAFADITGFQFGERITQHHEVVRYFEALAETSPRVSLQILGESWEGRTLLMAVVTSPENHNRIDEIRMNARRLGDPRTTGSNEVSAIIDSQPAVVWLGGSIHGFELSGTEGLLRLLERLTTSDDDETMHVLENTVVLIDPVLNPDGRDAFVYYNLQRGGRVPNPERFDWGNDVNFWEALSFRTGHYFFDINRDWFLHSQPETRARVPVFLQWRPQVGVDAHEMGIDVEFYFDPPTDPVSPHFPPYALQWFEVFGRAHADAFDDRGFEYTKREMFNYFFPAYTTSYLSYQGAVGMLYEQGQTRGLAIRRQDGSVRTLEDGTLQQYTAAWALVRTAAREREALLRDYYQSLRDALEEGRRGIRRYVLTEGTDPQSLVGLVNLLIRNGIEVYRLNEDTQFGGMRDREGRSAGRIGVPAGSYMVEASQPRGRLVRALLEPHIPIPEEFLDEARERVDRGENPRFYDITAYSLPLLFNVQTYGTTDARSVDADRVETAIAENGPTRAAGYAYLIDGAQAAAVSALYHLRDMGYRVAMTTEPSRIQGIDFARGTVVIRTNQAIDGVHDAVREAAERFGLRVDATDTGRAEPGFTSSGSPTTIDFRKPEIAIVADYPVFGYSFGWLWYTLDRQYEIPHTVLRAGSLASERLDRFDVIVLPSVSAGVFKRILGEEGIERLKRWVHDGGVLVAIAEGAVDFVREHLELTSLRSWYDREEHEKAQRFAVPGAVLRARADMNTWLTAGLPEDLPVLVNSSAIFLPSDDPPSPARRVALSYDVNDLLIAGHAWEESLERLPGTVFAYEERVGSGRVIVFAEDINFRGYLRGISRLLLNAVVVGPSAP
jgi:hypothetical protein